MSKKELLQALKGRRDNGGLNHIAEGIRHLAIPVESVSVNARNERIHDQRSIETIQALLDRFGQRVPIVVQKQGMITRDGNGRLMAARDLGWTHIAALVVDESNADAIAYAIGANRSPELAEWDTDILRLEFEELGESGVDTALLGYSQSEIEEMFGAFDVEEVEPPSLDSGDKKPFQQITFTLHDEQAEEVRAALDKAKQAGYGQSSLNDNSNGNALAFICRTYAQSQ